MKRRGTGKLLVALLAIAFALGMAPAAALAAEGDLMGASVLEGLTVQDDMDGDHYDVNLSEYSIAYDGDENASQMPEIDVVHWRYSDGVDFFEGYVASSAYDVHVYSSDQEGCNPYDGEWPETTVEPKTIGDYYVRAVSKEAGLFDVFAEFSIVDTKDLENAEMKIPLVIANGEEQTPPVFLRVLGVEIPSDKYDLTYLKETDEGIEEVAFVKDAGNYWVRAEAKEGSGYKGQTDDYLMTVFESNVTFGADDIECDYNNGLLFADDYDLNIELSVRDDQGFPFVVPESFYTVTYQKSMGWNDEGTEQTWSDEFGDKPTEAGAYRFIIRGSEGGVIAGYDSLTSSDDPDSSNGFNLFEAVDLADVTIDGIKDFAYNGGNALEPYIELWFDEGDGGQTYYQEGDDYHLVFQMKKDGAWVDVGQIAEVGEYRAVITGLYPKGLCKGEMVTGSFFVREGVEIHPYVQFGDYDNYVFPEDAQEMLDGISVWYWSDDDDDAFSLTTDDYDMMVVKNKGDADAYVPVGGVYEPGSYYIKVSCKNGYVGSVYEEFTVVTGNELDYANIEVESLFYTGSALTPSITATLLNKTKLTTADSELVVSNIEYLDESQLDEDGDPIWVPRDEIVDAGEYTVELKGAEGVDCIGTASVTVRVYTSARMGGEDGSVSQGIPCLIRNGVRDALLIEGLAYDNDGDSQYVELIEGVHFELTEITDENGNPINEITEAGQYFVRAVALEGSGVSGTAELWIDVYNGNDLAIADFDYEVDPILEKNGKSVPKLYVYMGGEAVPESAYTATFEKEGVTTEYPNSLEGFGVWEVTITAIDGQGYTGSMQETLHVHYVKELYWIDLDKDEYAYTGKPVALKPVVYSYQDEVVPASEYTLEYERYDAKDDVYVAFDGAPTDPGMYSVYAVAKESSEYGGNSYWHDFTIAKPVVVAKKANPMTAKAKTVTVKAKKVKKKTQKIAAAKAVAVAKAQGKVTYKLTKVSAKKKLLKQAKKKIKVAANGSITVKKGLKKGTYTLTVQVSAAGNASYNAATKTVKVKVKVK